MINKIKEWIKENALCQTSYSDVCWDLDGDIMFKRSDISKKGDWSQEEWNKQILDFEETYIDYKEFIEFLDTLKE